MTWLQFLILSLASFRLALLLSDDDGPAGAFRRLRHYLSRKARNSAIVRKSEVHKGIQCQRCSSMWICLPISPYVIFHASLPQWLVLTGDGFLLWNALSACTIIINRIPEKK